MGVKGKREHWVVVGGGILGLTLALRLAQARKSVTLLEAGSSVGGLASSWQLGEIHWDKHYHVTLLSDSAIRRILDEIGLAEEMRWVETKTGFYSQAKLSPISNSIDYLKLPGLTLIDKLRLASTIIYASKIRNWKALEKVSAVDWLSRLSGRRVFDKLWKPLLKAKLGENFQLASAAFIWSVISRLYAARRTGLKKEMFGYVRGGYARVLSQFQDTLAREGVHIRTSSPVQDIRQSADGSFSVSIGNGETISADRVVCTAPLSTIAEICPNLQEAEKQQLRSIEYQGIICASLVLQQSLADYYLTYITDPASPFTAVVEMSAFVDKAEFGGKSLVYLPKYLPSDSKDFERSDAEILQEFTAGLARMYPKFKATDIVTAKISRVRKVFAIPTLNYSQLVPEFSTSVPGLHIVSSAQIVNGTLNVNETVQLAETALLDLLAQPQPIVRDLQRAA